MILIDTFGVVAHLSRAFEWDSKGRALETPRLQFLEAQFFCGVRWFILNFGNNSAAAVKCFFPVVFV